MPVYQHDASAYISKQYQILNMKLLFLFTVLLFLNCEHQTVESVAKENAANSDFLLSVLEYKDECFPVANARINDTVPFVMKSEQFIKVFGKPDSIIEMPVSEYGTFLGGYESNAKLYCWIKGRSVFKQKGDKIYPYILDLASTPVSISNDSIRWDIFTLSTDIKSEFPISTRLHKGRHGNGFRGFISIDASCYNQGDQLWYLLFQNDGLTRIIFFDLPFVRVHDIDKIRKSIKSKNKD